VDNLANLPPNLQHSPGSSSFSDETQATFNYEKTQKELINAPKAVALDKPKISERIRGLVDKLFY
jgi:hypothetical protein